jgi:hypothetical protein
VDLPSAAKRGSSRVAERAKFNNARPTAPTKASDESLVLSRMLKFQPPWSARLSQPRWESRGLPISR